MLVAAWGDQPGRAVQIGAQIVLGDRLVSVTLARAWASLGHWERVRCLCSLLFGGLTASKSGVQDVIKDLEASPGACPPVCSACHAAASVHALAARPCAGPTPRSRAQPSWPPLQDSDALTEAVKELATSFPGLGRTLLDERNLFMVHMLRRIASLCAPAPVCLPPPLRLPFSGPPHQGGTRLCRTAAHALSAGHVQLHCLSALQCQLKRVSELRRPGRAVA